MLQELLQYKQWAEQRTLQAIRQLNTATYPQAADFTRQQLNHIVIVEELFRARLEDQPAPHSSTNTELLPPLEAIELRLQLSNRWFTDYLRSLSNEALKEVIRFTFADGQPGSMSREEIFIHIINHSTYHRGVISHSLDLSGVPHPADTFSVFTHTQEPQRRQ